MKPLLTRFSYICKVQNQNFLNQFCILFFFFFLFHFYVVSSVPNPTDFWVFYNFLNKKLFDLPYKTHLYVLSVLFGQSKFSLSNIPHLHRQTYFRFFQMSYTFSLEKSCGFFASPQYGLAIHSAMAHKDQRNSLLTARSWQLLPIMAIGSSTVHSPVASFIVQSLACFPYVISIPHCSHLTDLLVSHTYAISLMKLRRYVKKDKKTETKQRT